MRDLAADSFNAMLGLKIAERLQAGAHVINGVAIDIGLVRKFDPVAQLDHAFAGVVIG
ncbi:hypothetical protein [Ruegeria arenilitoris]|uniref:hypothetical protein n=1 Tax=Ruegeria arenilitoris TaxID=1173585 RepID=UPI001C2CA9BF|nr:hypothetical protein [Ruegeria arenilitoris]